MRHITRLFLLIIVLGSFSSLNAQEGYQLPPRAIADLVNAPQTPAVSIDEKGEWMLLLERPGYPSVKELAQKELRIAGLRINPRTMGPSRSSGYTGITVKKIRTGEEFAFDGMPATPDIGNVRWSPDGSMVAFTQTTDSGIELWIADVSSRTARRISDGRVSDVIGSPYEWFPDSRQLLVKMIPDKHGDEPVRNDVPSGPVVQESTGEKAIVRTYQDLLQDPHDEALFEYYCTVELFILAADGSRLRRLGEKGMIRSMDISPNGEYILTGTMHRPFSYLVPYYRFPVSYDMYDVRGRLIRQISDIPLLENIPKGFDAVAEGPRSYQWRSDHPATLYWVEALDGGDPSRDAEHRDQLFFLTAPFEGPAQSDVALPLRYAGIMWGDDGLAIVQERWRATRTSVINRFVPGKENSLSVLFDFSYEDRYQDPGDFVMRDNASGRAVLWRSADNKSLYMTGQGASPEGNRPFVRSFDLSKKTIQELWRSSGPYYETPVRILDPRKGEMITRRESNTEVPNYYLRNWKKGTLQSATEFPDPYPALQGVSRQVIHYYRADSLPLQGDLYLPAGYDPEKDGPLPVIMWAYPREFKSADAAGQVSGSPHQFIRLNWGSPLYWVTQGYAVFDNLGMPIIGEGDQEPNDNFREQLVANAEAAVNAVVELGVGDRNRIAVGGHSYGAFMTANLLAHSDLFAAGIARSGAYNRTLTPFGFQSEERTYWDNPEVYYTMSPFMHADKVNEPILLIHGEADNNSGTFPIQSERFYSAIKGLGGTARLVMLPHESHGYRGRESILHALYEQHNWLEKHVKNKTAKAGSTNP